jgi:glycine cleavage system H protein
MVEYDEGRIWYRKKGKMVTIGLTEKAFEEVGDLESISLPAEGDEFTRDDVIAELSGTKNGFEVICPVDGLVHLVNDELNSNIDVLMEDPLDEGWICQIKVESMEDVGEVEFEAENA